MNTEIRTFHQTNIKESYFKIIFLLHISIRFLTLQKFLDLLNRVLQFRNLKFTLNQYFWY